MKEEPKSPSMTVKEDERGETSPENLALPNEIVTVEQEKVEKTSEKARQLRSEKQEKEEEKQPQDEAEKQPQDEAELSEPEDPTKRPKFIPRKGVYWEEKLRKDRDKKNFKEKERKKRRFNEWREERRKKQG